METAMDRALRGEPTGSERKRQKRTERRAPLSDKQKFEEWLKSKEGAVGTLTLPSDISRLPKEHFVCGCQKPIIGKPSKQILRVTRSSVKEPWRHYNCQAQKGNA